MNTQHDPQKIVADAFLEMGLDKQLMAETTDRDNIKRNIRRFRQVARKDPANPKSRDTFEVGLVRSKLKRTSKACKDQHGVLGQKGLRE